MMLAVVTTTALLLGGLVAAFSLTWRRYALQPIRVEAKVEGPTCYPRVKR